jgi:hypothetical protein
VGNFDAAFALLLGTIPSVATRFNYDAAGTALPLGTGRNRDWRYDEYEFYAQDSWRMRNDLTLTCGGRYHVYDLGGKANDARPFYDTDWNNFAPRLQFAYNPAFSGGVLGALFGERRTVIRGGGSVTYDRPGGGITFLQDQSTYIFDTVVTTNFPAADANAGLLNYPRFTSINSVPVQNIAPTVTRPFTPRVTNGVGTGLTTANNYYAVDPNFRIPYSLQYSLGFQRELPGNFILEAAYVGRQGRKQFSIADASQVLDFKDSASGQFMLAAFNSLQDQLNAHAATVTPQPWFENQINAARAARGLTPCLTRFGVSCTEVVAANFGALVATGNTADTVQALYANGLLRPNVGLSSQSSRRLLTTEARRHGLSSDISSSCASLPLW